MQCKRHRVVITCVICLAATIWGVGAYGDVLHVDVDATAEANKGLSWTDAYTDLQSALNIAVSGDEIWVAEGTYKPSLPAGRDATFQLKRAALHSTEVLLALRQSAVNGIGHSM